MFQFPALTSHVVMICLQHTRLSHSEICGSKVICTYPQLIAAYHVLHRLREPRHPPCALTYFLSLTVSIKIDTLVKYVTLLDYNKKKSIHSKL